MRGFCLSARSLWRSVQVAVTTRLTTATARKQRMSTSTHGSIYPYETKRATRYRFVYRDAAGRQSTARGFTSKAAARRARELLLGKVHRGEIRVSRRTLGDDWWSWLARRRPFLEEGPGTTTAATASCGCCRTWARNASRG